MGVSVVNFDKNPPQRYMKIASRRQTKCCEILLERSTFSLFSFHPIHFIYFFVYLNFNVYYQSAVELKLL